MRPPMHHSTWGYCTCGAHAMRTLGHFRPADKSLPQTDGDETAGSPQYRLSNGCSSMSLRRVYGSFVLSGCARCIALGPCTDVLFSAERRNNGNSGQGTNGMITNNRRGAAETPAAGAPQRDVVPNIVNTSKRIARYTSGRNTWAPIQMHTHGTRSTPPCLPTTFRLRRSSGLPAVTFAGALPQGGRGGGGHE